MRGTLRQGVSAFIASIGVFSLGCVLSWTSASLYKIQAEGSLGNITSQNFAQLSSTATLGAMVASPLAGLSSDYLGRKNTMVILAPLFSIGWLILGCSTNLATALVGRFITGFCGGGFGVCTPIYISEISEDRIRGVLASFFQLMLVIGILFADVVGTFFSGENLAFISSIFTIALCLLLCPMRESPRALLCKRKFIAARDNLYYFRGVSKLSSVDTIKVQPIEQELALIGDSIRRSGSFRWKEIFHAPFRRPILICISLVIFKSPVIIFYAFNIFKSVDANIDSNQSLCIVAAVQVLATLVSSVLVDKCGRRILLIISESVMGLTLFALGTFFHLKKSEEGLVLIGHLEWLPLVSLALFIISFSLGAGPLSWTIMAEIIPPNIKGICSSIATTFVWFLAFLLTNTYSLLVESIGTDYAFYFFACICLIGSFVIFFCLPETKGLSLDAIQELFAK